VYDHSRPLELELPYNNRYCRVQFSLTDYTRPENNVYAYMLEGVDRNWVNIGNQNSVRFTALPPGDYRLLIRAAGSNGIWSPVPASVLIRVAGPLYGRWWFILLAAMLVGSVIYGIFLLRIRQFKRLAEMRIRIASDLHDEVGSVLTRVAMQAELAGVDTGQERPDVMHAIIDSCRTAMSNMRDVVWTIDARNDKLSNLIDRMNGHLLKMTENSRFTGSFEYDASISNDAISPEARQNIFLIFKEAVNNSLKHSTGRHISARFYRDNNVLVLLIADDGDAAIIAASDGTGVRNMQMRAQRIGATLEISRSGDGYMVIIKKPFK
jgi:signal transduction histidine kinase